MLSNGKLKNMESEPLFDDFTFLRNFVKSKNRKVFRRMRDITKILSKFRCINGLEVIKDCEGSKWEDSKFTINNSIKLLRLLFLLSLKILINVEETEEEGSESESEEEYKIT